MLSAACLGKRRELRQHAGGRKRGGQAGPEIMRLWKQTLPPAVLFGSWSEVAGFFDAEGCFDTRLKSIEIRVSQKHAAPLEALRVFLLQRLGIQANIYEYGSGHVLMVGASKSVKMICRELLQAGLRQKRVQAELVLSHSPANHAEVRTMLQELKGNQGQFIRSDNEGISRALEIHSLQVKRWHLRQSPRIGLPEVAKELAELTVKIDELKEEHQRKELEREIRAMQARLEDVRRASE